MRLSDAVGFWTESRTNMDRLFYYLLENVDYVEHDSIHKEQNGSSPTIAVWGLCSLNQLFGLTLSALSSIHCCKICGVLGPRRPVRVPRLRSLLDQSTYLRTNDIIIAYIILFSVFR